MSYKKSLALFMSVVMVCVSCLSVSALSIVDIRDSSLSQINTVTEFSADRIDELIIQAGEIKNKMGFIKEQNPDTYSTDTEYIALSSQLADVKAELSSLGAVPSLETLANFPIDSEENSNARGILIDDFADFEQVWGNTYDLWGISRQIEASYGTYDLYEIVIQDGPGCNRLTSQLYQNGNAMVQVFPTSNTSIGELTGESILDVGISTAAGALAGLILSPVSSVLAGFASATFDVLHSVTSGLTDDQVYSDFAEDTYHIYCRSQTTMRFTYVRPEGSTVWSHCHSAGSTAIYEEHIFHYAIYDPSLQADEIVNSTIERTKTITPDRFAYRGTDAITNYRNGNYLNGNITINIVDEYNLYTTYIGNSYLFATMQISNATEYDDLWAD